MPLPELGREYNLAYRKQSDDYMVIATDADTKDGEWWVEAEGLTYEIAAAVVKGLTN